MSFVQATQWHRQFNRKSHLGATSPATAGTVAEKLDESGPRSETSFPCFPLWKLNTCIPREAKRGTAAFTSLWERTVLTQSFQQGVLQARAPGLPGHGKQASSVAQPFSSSFWEKGSVRYSGWADPPALLQTLPLGPCPGPSLPVSSNSGPHRSHLL